MFNNEEADVAKETLLYYDHDLGRMALHLSLLTKTFGKAQRDK